jgi:hypothetical protein
MPTRTEFSQYAESCAICGRVTELCWTDLDLDARICHECAESLIEHRRRARASNSPTGVGGAAFDITKRDNQS